MKCLLAVCAHAKSGCCNTFGGCGAGALLKMAEREQGVRVHFNDNPTLAHLQKAGLVSVYRQNDNLAIVQARKASR